MPTHRKSHVAFRLAYLHLIFAHSKGQDRGQMVTARAKVILLPQILSHVSFRLANLELEITLAYSKGQRVRRNSDSPIILVFLFVFASLFIVFDVNLF